MSDSMNSLLDTVASNRHYNCPCAFITVHFAQDFIQTSSNRTAEVFVQFFIKLVLFLESITGAE